MSSGAQQVAHLLAHTIGGVWGTEPGTDACDVDVVRSTNFTPDGVLVYENAAARSISRTALASRRLQAGDILLEKSGGGPNQPVGRVVFVEDDPGDVVCSNFVQLLRPERDVNPRWLFYILWLAHASGETLEYQAQTIGIRNLRTQEYLARQIAVPDPGRQATIAEVGAALDTALAAAKDNQIRAEGLLNSLRDKLIGEDWPTCQPLGSRTAQLGVGRSPRCLDRPPLTNEWGVLKVSAVQRGRFLPEEAKALPENVEPFLAAQLRSGDVLVTRSNTVDRVGFACVVEHDFPFLLLSDLVFRLRTGDGLSPHYLAEALSATQLRNEISAVAAGTSGSMKKLNQAKIRALHVPVPPPDRQRAVVATLRPAAVAAYEAKRHVQELRALKMSVLSSLLHDGIPSADALSGVAA